MELVATTIQGSSIIGSLVAGNSRGLVISGLATDDEIAVLEKHRKVMLLWETMNAAGNVIMVNDTFAAVHPDLPVDIAAAIGEFLDVIAEHLSGWAEEWIIWNTQEFGFISLPDAICTGQQHHAPEEEPGCSRVDPR